MDLIAPEPGLIFWKFVAFLIFLYVLYRFGWGPITESLEAREKEIESSIQRAEEALEEAKDIQAENKKARREAERKAQEILREARESAEELREDEEAKTRRRIQQMQEQAQSRRPCRSCATRWQTWPSRPLRRLSSGIWTRTAIESWSATRSTTFRQTSHVDDWSVEG